MKVKFCDPDEGVVVWGFSDAACTAELTEMSTDQGCPTGGCCHISGTLLAIDIDGNGTPDLNMAFAYQVTGVIQTGSRYGFGFGDLIGEFFASLG